MLESFERFMAEVNKDLPSYNYFLIGYEPIQRMVFLEMPVDQTEYELLLSFIDRQGRDLSLIPNIECFKLDMEGIRQSVKNTPFRDSVERMYNPGVMGLTGNYQLEWYLQRQVKFGNDPLTRF